MRIALAGGGTAGHVNPLLATALAITSGNQDVEVLGVGTAGGLEEDLVPAAGVELELIARVPFPRRPNTDLIKFPVALRSVVQQAHSLIERRRIDVVVGFGGYASTPMYLAAKKAGIPFVVHEGNARPGLANRLGARHAHIVALTFASTPLKAQRGTTVTIGLPMRPQIRDLAQSADRAGLRVTAAERFGLDPNRPILLVTGGSSGAVHLNNTLAEASTDVLSRGIQILHITGRDKDGPVREKAAGQPGYVVLDYLTTMEDAYAVADLAITRAGAGMVAELSALGIPAVFVPLPVGNGEQALNAKDVVDAGGAILVNNDEFTPQWLVNHAMPLFNGGKLTTMSAQATSVSPLDAAEKLADMTMKLGEGAQ